MLKRGTVGGCEAGLMKQKRYKRKCIKVLTGNTFEIDTPIHDTKIIQLSGIKKGNKNKLKKMIEGKEVDIVPTILIIDLVNKSKSLKK